MNIVLNKEELDFKVIVTSLSKIMFLERAIITIFLLYGAQVFALKTFN
ncbi:hypothetical protein [Clostridium beijerinckii]|nr:hypothetical protein [Clostridium beijerinckii]NRT51313.1 hypothetical protein [Clostridium beijerinckii]NRT93443.1 hypothetical protein [Clostridium beijerinckii]NRU11343.1 hypothetical protein [Clostridium beijerinckii]NRU22560.1 hypothetical protein [Clostridium beijerinckii]NRU35227.1 hypothetical protein [Clostridium beijerinckii]